MPDTPDPIPTNEAPAPVPVQTSAPPAPPAVATPLQRIQAALAECPHPRGSNWQPVMAEVGKGRRKKKKPGFRNPCIALMADDIVAVCDRIGTTPDRIVNDLLAGSEEYCGLIPPMVVHIHVDDAFHLVDVANGISPTPPAAPPRGPQPVPPQLQ